MTQTQTKPLDKVLVLFLIVATACGVVLGIMTSGTIDQSEDTKKQFQFWWWAIFWIMIGGIVGTIATVLIKRFTQS